MLENEQWPQILVTSEYPPNTSGGIQRTVNSFVSYCARERGQDVTWIFPTKKRKSIRKSPSNIDGVTYVPVRPIVNLPILEKFPNSISKRRLSLVTGQAKGPIVVHSPDTIGMTVSQKLDLRQRETTTVVWNCPLNIRADEVDFTSIKNYLAYLATHPLYGLRNTMLLHYGVPTMRAVFNSQTVKDTFQETFPKVTPSEWVIIPPATEYCHECHLSKEKPSDEFVVLTVGRITAKKGTGRLFELASHLEGALNNTDKRVKFRIAGDLRGPYGQWLKEESLKTNSRLSHCSFEILGYVPDGDSLCQIYNEADMFLLPSTIEAFGLVFAEAASHGLPLAGFNSRGSAEVISQFGPAGFLAQLPNTEGYTQLADHIHSLIFSSSEHRNQLSLHAKQKALSLFSSNLINSKLLDFITRN